MIRTDAVNRLAAEYLEAVGTALACRPEEERRDILAQLNEQLDEAIRKAEPVAGESEEAAMGRLLEEMDPPESFVPADGDEAGASAVAASAGGSDGGGAAAPAGAAVRERRGGPGGWWWFALAVLFFIVNVWGIWGPGRRGGDGAREIMAGEPAVVPAPEAPKMPPVRPERILRLRRVSIMDVAQDRRVTLLLTFSADPDRLQLTRYLTVSDSYGHDLDYRLAGMMGGHTVAVETEPVLTPELKWKFAAGLPAADPEVGPVDENDSGQMEIVRNLEFRSAEAETPPFGEPHVKLFLNRIPAAEPERLKEFVEVKPEVPVRVSAASYWKGACVELAGPFKPDGIYEITLKEGLPGANGETLPRDAVCTLQVPRPSARVEVEKAGRYLPPSGPLAIPVRTCGVKSVRVTGSKIYPNNLASAAMAGADRNRVGYEWLGKSVTLTNLAVQLNEDEADTGRVLVPVRRLANELGGDPLGPWWIEVEAEGTSWTSDRQLVVASDIGLSARLEYNAGVLTVWANSLRTAKALEGVRLELVSSHHQPLAAGTTDADGLARLEWELPPDCSSPSVLVASKGEDRTYLSLESQIWDDGWDGERSWPREGEAEAEWIAGRGVYRPGETVQVQALVRNIHLDVPEPFPAVASIRAPDGKVWLEKAVEVDALGTVAEEFALPADAPTGNHRLSLETPDGGMLGSTTFAVEDFVPPQIRVDVEGPEGRQGTGNGKLRFEVKAEYLFGGAASRLPVSAGVAWRSAAFAPAAWKGWSFGDGRKSYPWREELLGQFNLSEDGTAVYMVDPAEWRKPPAALRALFRATVRTAGGRTVSAYAPVDVDPYPFYLGLRPAWEGSVPVGSTQRVQVAVVAPDGSAWAPEGQEAPSVLLSLLKIEWNSALRKNSSGRWEWRTERSEQVVSKTAKPLPGGEPGEWAFEVPDAGEYEVLAEDPESGSSTRISFRAGPGDWWWYDDTARANPAALHLAWEGEGPRKAGDTAKLLVRAPFAGEALLTVESDRLLLAKRLTLEKNTAEVELEVGEDWAPSVYVAMSVIRPAVPGGTAWMGYRAHGGVALQVDRPERRLAVTVAAPASVRPRSPLDVDLCVLDAEGNPAQGKVTVFAVDEAICMLTGHESPDPLARFNAIRDSITALYDLYGSVIEPEAEDADGVSAPGGGDAGALGKRLNPVRANRFKPLAMWRPGVPLDAEGRVRTTFDLPEFTGEIRLMAVAYTATGLGAASASVKVLRDLVVQPSLPRFLAPGDRCEVTIPVHNRSGEAMTVRVRASCGGPLSCAEPERTLELAAGESGTVAFPLEAGGAAGKAFCTVEAEGGAERYSETFELAVRPAGGLSLRAQGGVLKPGESADFAEPDEFLSGSAVRTLHISSMPSLNLCRALQYVVFYPYGCLEQTVSGALPLLGSEAWASRLAPGAWAAGSPSERVGSAIARIMQMQTERGGFALWPWLRDDDTENSLYALQFLLAARAAGYDVPANALDAALAWARSRVLEARVPTTSDTRSADWRRDMRLRAEACHVLALAGRPPAGWIDRLCERTADLDFTARVHLACALRESGDPRRAADLLASLPVPVPRARRGGDCHDGDVREAALLLSAWLDADAEAPVVMQLAAYLRSRRNDQGHWGCTQDNALVLAALAKMAHSLPAVERPVSAEITRPGEPGAAPWRKNGVRDARHADRAGGTLRLANTGDAPLYYFLQTEGVAAEPPPLCSQGIRVDRAFFDWNGHPMDPTELKQGDFAIVRVEVRKLNGGPLENLAVEDLLPAGWEVENMALKTSSGSSWLSKQMENDGFWSDARDDRMIFFLRWWNVDGVARVHYAVRAVTPGEYVLPSVVASGMYDPSVRAVGPEPRSVRVVP